MMKNFLLVVALLSLALAVGCAKGGNGIGPAPINISITPPTGSDFTPSAVYPGQSITLQATVTPMGVNPAVTWSLSGTGCTGAACGTLTPTTPAPVPATAVYVAPGCVSQTTCLSGAQPLITATLVANTSITGIQNINLVDITTLVAPLAPNIGTGLVQQFVATALPDAAPQTFKWNCTANGALCANFVQDPNISGLAYYTAQDNCSGACVQISAISPLDPAGCNTAKSCSDGTGTVVTSRVNGTYAFRFSGYDGSNNATAVVGTFTASNGTITSGTEEELTSTGWKQNAISGGSYSPITASNPNSNNAGSLTLNLPAGVYPDRYQVVLDSAGDLSLIESDGHGSGSGLAQLSAGSNPFKGYQVFAFGFTGVDSSFNRVGYVGILPMDGVGNITGGSMDSNDNGSATTLCSTPPCTVTGTYTSNGNGSYNITLTAPVAMSFDFYVASGSTASSTPLTFYAISTDFPTNPAVSGTMVLQNSSARPYNNTALNGSSVSALTGIGTNASGAIVPGTTNVSLTIGNTDGNGDFSGNFDQNNAGTILTVPTINPDGTCQPAVCGFENYTYNSSTSATGRYTFQMLGNPIPTPMVNPLPFVLYASGPNRGFLLDQSSPSVMTGTMSPQGKGSGFLGATQLPGPYSGATTSSGSSAVSPIADNVLMTYAGGTPPVNNVTLTQYPGSQTVVGTYTMNSAGNGVIAPIMGATTPNYAIYAIDTVGCTKQSGTLCVIQDFMMIDEDTSNTNASVIFVKQ
jgi:hypothetical protein